jgi:hypothetical protein
MFLLITVCVVAVFGRPPRADVGDKLTYFTFSAPVELPGITLPAGTYAFKLLDTVGNRNIVQVFDKSMTRLYGTFLTIADYRQQPSEKSVIRFSETEEGGPPAIKEWFYPGDSYGCEFVYPKNRATQLAKASNQAVPSMAQNMTSQITGSNNSYNQASASNNSNNTNNNANSQQTPASNASGQENVAALENTPVMAEQPSGHEVELAEVFVLTPAPGAAAPTSRHNILTESDTSAGTLPKTASLLPLLGLLGIALVFSGIALKLLLVRTGH